MGFSTRMTRNFSETVCSRALIHNSIRQEVFRRAHSNPSPSFLQFLTLTKGVVSRQSPYKNLITSKLDGEDRIVIGGSDIYGTLFLGCGTLVSEYQDSYTSNDVFFAKKRNGEQECCRFVGVVEMDGECFALSEPFRELPASKQFSSLMRAQSHPSSITPLKLNTMRTRKTFNRPPFSTKNTKTSGQCEENTNGAEKSFSPDGKAVKEGNDNNDFQMKPCVKRKSGKPVQQNLNMSKNASTQAEKRLKLNCKTSIKPNEDEDRLKSDVNAVKFYAELAPVSFIDSEYERLYITPEVSKYEKEFKQKLENTNPSCREEVSSSMSSPHLSDTLEFEEEVFSQSNEPCSSNSLKNTCKNSGNKSCSILIPPQVAAKNSKSRLSLPRDLVESSISYGECTEESSKSIATPITPSRVLKKFENDHNEKTSGFGCAAINGMWNPINFSAKMFYNLETGVPKARSVCEESLKVLSKSPKLIDYYPFLEMASEFHGKNETLEKLCLGQAFMVAQINKLRSSPARNSSNDSSEKVFDRKTVT
uniref:Ribonuclease P n=2 Tax=Caenorhabditis tropicalis TaxID=1561998 RepID=A0A1I7T2A0_9PELO